MTWPQWNCQGSRGQERPQVDGFGKAKFPMWLWNGFDTLQEPIAGGIKRGRAKPKV